MARGRELVVPPLVALHQLSHHSIGSQVFQRNSNAGQNRQIENEFVHVYTSE